MKHGIVLLSLLVAAAGTSSADALKKEYVSPDAKWLIHLDCDNLRKTAIGDFLITKVAGPLVADATGEFKFNITNVLQRISSLTAYGDDFAKGADANGVLLIHSDAETQKALVGVLVAQILANTNGPVKQLESQGEHAVYSFANQVFISPQEGGPIVVSKSEAQLEAARERLQGKGRSLASSRNFDEFPAISNSFFFVGLADASSLPKQIPARAKVLQMADGGRVAMGEKADRLFLNLALRGKTPEVTRQMHQVIEGMIALVSLGQPDNADLTGLVQSTRVASKDKLISINVEYPTRKVIAALSDQLDSKPAKKKAKAKAKAKEDWDSEAEETVKPEAEETVQE